jgi:DNA-binding transcriptional LysR family regulator
LHFLHHFGNFEWKEGSMRHLQSFKYVKIISKTGSIRGAAESLTISPSALNRHIQTLELDLGIQIFDRLTKGVRLSTEGELFFQFALRQLASFEQLQSQIDDLKGLRTGVVRMGVSGDLGLAFVHAQIVEYQNDHPEVSFELKTITQDELEPALTANQIDMALFYQPRLGRNLQVIHAVETQVHAAMPHGAPIRDKSGLMLYELLDHAILMPAQGTELRQKVDAGCEKLGISLRAKMECADPLPHLSATTRSRIAFCLPLPTDRAKYQTRGYSLVPMTSKELGTGFVNLVCVSQALMPIAAQKFIERLTVAFEAA